MKSEYCTNPKRPNRCAEFLFNEIPADDCSGNRVYKPRKKRTSQFAQPKLFDIPTDKQSNNETVAEIAELRECLKEAVREKCPFTRMSCRYGEQCDYECGTEKWRKALKGINNATK